MTIVKRYLCAIFFLSAIISCNTFADTQATEPLSFNSRQTLVETSQLKLAPLDNKSLAARDTQTLKAKTAVTRLRYAEPRPVSFLPKDERWDLVTAANSPSGEATYVWRGAVQSPGALTLNLGFSRYRMPAGGSLHIYTPDRSTVVRPFTNADNKPHGQLWTPIVSGDTLVIEVNVPASKFAELELTLSSINHGYIGHSVNAIYQVSLKSGGCNVDVACPAGDGWRDQIRSVAAYGTGDGLFCTGAALNNTAANGKPFFLTAHHCEVDAAAAPSVVVYWNFQNSTCRTPGSTASGGQGDGKLNQFNTGAILRAAYQPADMTLLELDSPIDPAFNVYLAGWDASSRIPSSAVGIHHPNSDEKRISLENDPLSVDQNHLVVNSWDLGVTEPGSSGSPLFNQDKRVVGQLTGGESACGNKGGDSYGWLFKSWTGGGSSSTRLSNWLDPTGTGKLFIDGRNAKDSTTPPATNNQLQKGVPITGISAAQGKQLTFTMAVPANATNLKITLSGNSGDADLYVKFGAAATTSTHDCAPYLDGSNEECTFAQGKVGTYYVMLDAYAAFSNLTLVANYDLVTQPTLPTSGQNTNINLKTGKWFRHTIVIPANTKTLTVTTSGGSGDADLFVKRGSAPSTSSYDCSSESDTTKETCTIKNPAAGTWYVGVFGYIDVTGVKEQWNFTK